MPLDDAGPCREHGRERHVAQVLRRFLERALDDNPELMLAVLGAVIEQLLRDTCCTRSATDAFLEMLAERMADVVDDDDDQVEI